MWTNNKEIGSADLGNQKDRKVRGKKNSPIKSKDNTGYKY